MIRQYLLITNVNFSFFKQLQFRVFSFMVISFIAIEAYGINFGFTISPISDVVVDENSVYTSAAPSIKGTPAGNIVYTLSGRDAFDFTVDHASGIVSMIGRNYESPADANVDNIYEVTIIATDAGNNSDSESWKVSIKDVVEPAVFDIGAIADVAVNENTLYTSAVPVITGAPIGGIAAENFTIVPIPDTQYYTSEKYGGKITMFKTQTDWIVANKDALNIKYVVQLGDCAEDGDNAGNPIQWMRADTAVSILENPVSTHLPHGIPYGPNVGNHDQSPMGNASGTTNFYNKYFGTARYAGRDYYRGHYGTNNNSNFQLFSAGGMDFIALNLEFDPLANPRVLNWADSLLKTYVKRRALVSSHFIINPNGGFGAQGQAIYNKLKVNLNLFLMLCAHRAPNGEASRRDTYNGNTITTLLSDYQDRINGGNGWMRYMEFMPSENKVYVSTYSPTLNRYETDANSRFSFDYAMISGANQGSLIYTLAGADASRFSVNRSNGKISMKARNFEKPEDANKDNIYEVTLRATDGDGNQAAKSWKVIIADVVEGK